VNKEVIDFFHEAIDATVIVVSNPREKVVDGFFHTVGCNFLPVIRRAGESRK
jgi:predicted HAD superfamily phosphohydrolase YqeG